MLHIYIIIILLSNYNSILKFWGIIKGHDNFEVSKNFGGDSIMGFKIIVEIYSLIEIYS